ncbi:nuclear transport factor 2 family protein [Hoeflea ulvae]|uniref:Nuclear transport factor 2 family protein n=1 Tax=Hoeflea ulvae TaxID=2983764 RepID=A0ABT3YC33_9HYPH|nr:nuclear transport factor 2 family protein [Hoeflea ulvae]MCY0093442.1 nuclear transport factor 2 family protein [Hoeflea ulvae]
MRQSAELGSMVARQEITDVLVAYCCHLDRMELAALAALFTADCSVIYGEGPALAANGRPQLEQSLARMWRWKRTAHHLANVRITFSQDDEAQSESYVHAWHEAPDGRTATIFGRYLDRFVHTSGGWLIAQRQMEMNGADAGFKLPIPQAPRASPPAGWRPPAGLD